MSFSPNELVWYKQDGQIHSAGYSIDSMLGKTNVKPLTTLNEPIQQGGSSVSGQFSDLFRFMGVPAGLSTKIAEEMPDSTFSTEQAGIVSDSLFDKLMSLVGPTESSVQVGGNKKKKTRRASQKVGKKSTRRTRRK